MKLEGTISVAASARDVWALAIDPLTLASSCLKARLAAPATGAAGAGREGVASAGAEVET